MGAGRRCHGFVLVKQIKSQQLMPAWACCPTPIYLAVMQRMHRPCSWHWQCHPPAKPPEEHGSGEAPILPAHVLPAPATGLQGTVRRLVFVALYELIAIAVSSLLFMAIGLGAGASGVMAVVASTLAIGWNVTFNHLFEKWEARQTVKGRSVLRRVVHALGFEGGLALMLIPLMAWWFEVSLWQATWMEAGLLLFFLVYTYAFNWAFDQVFGLPASAQPASMPVA